MNRALLRVLCGLSLRPLRLKLFSAFSAVKCFARNSGLGLSDQQMTGSLCACMLDSHNAPYSRAADAHSLTPNTQDQRPDFLVSSSMLMVAVDRPDLGLRFLERIHVHHPVKNQRLECSAVRFAFLFRRNRSVETKLR